LLQPGETITADRYQQQLTNLSDALEEKRPFTVQECRKVILLHDNVRPHVATATQDHIFALGWEFLPHVAYSLDMALSDYYLFRSLQHHLADTHFVRFEEIRKCIDDFITSKPMSFYRQGIRKLSEKWQKIVDASGEYFD